MTTDKKLYVEGVAKIWKIFAIVFLILALGLGLYVFLIEKEHKKSLANWNEERKETNAKLEDAKIERDAEAELRRKSEARVEVVEAENKELDKTIGKQKKEIALYNKKYEDLGDPKIPYPKRLELSLKMLKQRDGLIFSLELKIENYEKKIIKELNDQIASHKREKKNFVGVIKTYRDQAKKDKDIINKLDKKLSAKIVRNKFKTWAERILIVVATYLIVKYVVD